MNGMISNTRCGDKMHGSSVLSCLDITHASGKYWMRSHQYFRDGIKGWRKVILFFLFSKFPVMVLCDLYKNTFS